MCWKPTLRNISSINVLGNEFQNIYSLGNCEFLENILITIAYDKDRTPITAVGLKIQLLFFFLIVILIFKKRTLNYTIL